MYVWMVFKPVFPRMRPILYSLLPCGHSCHCSVSWNGVSRVTLQFLLLFCDSWQLECSLTWPSCPASRSRVLKNLGGGVSLLWYWPHSSVCPVIIAHWRGGDLTHHAVQRGNWATEQRGSPTQGDLVTEGVNTCFSRKELQEFFRGLPG